MHLKKALVTLMDERFFIGYEGFIKSFLYYNEWFNLPFIVLDLGISEETKDKMRALYDKVEFREVDKDKYRGVDFSKAASSLQNTFYTLDVFNQVDLDRIVFLDMDIVVLGSLKPLFDCEYDIAACHGYDSKHDKMRADINSGVFVLNKKYINNRTYEGILQVIKKGYSMPDQKAINIYFKGKIHILDKRYNVEKRMLTTMKFKNILKEAKIIHFVASKPWDNDKPLPEQRYGELEDMWWKHYNEC